MTKVIVYRDGGEIIVESLNSGTICSFSCPKEAASGIIGTFINPSVPTQIKFTKKKGKGYFPLAKKDEKELRGYFNVNMLA
jgi:hypothetical protein